MVENFSGETHPSDGSDEILIDGPILNFYYDGESIQFPSKLLDIKNFENVFNVEMVQENFSKEEMDELF